jgi:glycosyltransferase involved in cell wall biosynthesis
MITPRVSVGVPGHNASETLKSSLSSLRSQDWSKECLASIYVDGASTDESVEIASEWADRLVRLTGFQNGPARNACVRKSSGEIVVFMDADVLARAGTIRALEMTGGFGEEHSSNYRFFCRIRRFRFALNMIPLHLLYYLYMVYRLLEACSIAVLLIGPCPG